MMKTRTIRSVTAVVISLILMISVVQIGPSAADSTATLASDAADPSSPAEEKSTVTCGTLETFELEMPQFSDGRTRTIRVWLPDGYDAEDSEKKYSVLYMHDGQNLFDAATSFSGEWEVDESLTKLMNDGYEPTIVVGVDNGGLRRFNELSPSWDLDEMGKEYVSSPEGEKYADFVINTVKPYVDAHYNTKPQPEYTSIGGSSMGGIMSLYMSMEYADVFDYGIIFSPALHIYNDDVIDKFLDNYDFTSMSNLPKLYLFAGAQTGNSDPGAPYDEACIEKYVDIVQTALTDRGYPAEIIGTKVDENEYHLESTWAKYFPIALQWLSNVERQDSYLRGDADGDGEVSITDVTLIQRFLANFQMPEYFQPEACNITGDESITISDATVIQRYLAFFGNPYQIGETVSYN